MQTTKFHASSILACGLVMTGCNNAVPAGDGPSSIKALEDLASGELVDEDRSCTGRQKRAVPDDRIVVDGQGLAHRQAVESYLSAVPEAVQAAFVKLGGRILVTSDVDKWCGAPLADRSSGGYVAPGQRRLDGCFVLASDRPNDPALRGSTLAIIHRPDVAAIRRNGVLVFGFLHAQLYPRLIKVPNASEGEAQFRLGNRERSALVEMKRNLASRFLRDVAGSSSFDLRALEGLLGDGAAQKVKSNIAASSSSDLLAGVAFAYASDPRWSDAERRDTADVRRRRFYDFVFANAFDSLHCNDATRATMVSGFAQTNQAFAAVNDDVLAVAAQVSASAGAFSLAEGDMFNSLAGPMFPSGPDNNNLMWNGEGWTSPSVPMPSYYSDLGGYFQGTQTTMAGDGIFGSSIGGVIGLPPAAHSSYPSDIAYAGSGPGPGTGAFATLLSLGSF